MPPIITILTDFGTADGYVAEMKGVLLTQAPGATLVDVSHDVGAHDVECGRLALARNWRRVLEKRREIMKRARRTGRGE